MPRHNATISDGDKLAFGRASSIHLIVPESLDKFQDDGLEILGSKQRELLYFDEIVPVAIILTTSLSREELESLVANVDLSITAHASSTAPPPLGHGTATDKVSTKVVLDSQIVSAGDSPTLHHHSEKESHVSATWTVHLHLRHPAQQLSRPAIHFTASASLRAIAQATIVNPDNEYMPSAVPAPENLLQSLQNSSAFEGTQIRLPATRIQKVTPRSTAASADGRPLRAASTNFSIVPALIVKRQRHSVGDTALVSLEIEVARWIKCDIRIENVSGRNKDTTSDPISTVAFPYSMKSGDRASFIFNQSLSSAENPVTPITGPSAALEMTIKAHALVSTHCNPTLRISVPAKAAPQSNRATRTTRHWQRQSTQPARPTSLTAPTAADQGLIFALHGPTEVTEGATFSIDVFVVNRSLKKRFMALVAVTRTTKPTARQRGSALFATGQQQQQQQQQNPGAGKAEAVIDDRSIARAMSSGGARPSFAEVVCLSVDVKVGPLLPGACHTTQLEFLCLAPGVVGLEAVSVIDLESKETVFLGEVPDIFALEKERSSN